MATGYQKSVVEDALSKIDEQIGNKNIFMDISNVF